MIPTHLAQQKNGSTGEVQIIQQDRFKHANPAKARFRESANISPCIIIEGRLPRAGTGLEGNHG
jgi:hypothetical protein